MKIAKTPYFFHDKPLFGLDIGHGSLKVMQLAGGGKVGGKLHPPRVVGYGFATFDKAAQQNGVVVQPEIIAKAALDLFEHHLVGDITTRRVALAIPTYRTFTRSMQLPKLKPSKLAEAVQLEAEQYISLPLNELYLDWDIIRETADGIELFVVAVPKTIVDSYLELAQLLGLETVLIEPTMSSSGRLFTIDERSELSTVIIDFGSLSSDISIFDKHTLVAGTVQGGGVDFTNSIKERLGVTLEEAGLIKTRYGLHVSKKQAEITAALEPTLEAIVKEVRRMIRYYEKHYDNDRPITQIITIGGGANMPGLSEYLTDVLRLAVRHTDPWQYLNYHRLQPPSPADKPMYATVAGLSLSSPKELFRS
ncbi:MAG TPA: type IV pilus assembly protein PilM [Candidatus Saccharimonadales bacterium]|nr:type IV pilus assembly protein PilM [Candidatus Saccharimonadales bacterium]